MTAPATPTALIAEDEALLADALKAELALLWPELRIVASVGDGASAVAQALVTQPDVLFFDIRMPGMSGIDAAAALADAWVTEGPGAKPFPALVFVTAYDQYAVAAFEAQAMDYLLKPVQADRLRKTVAKLQTALSNRSQPAIDFEATMGQLRALLGGAAAPAGAPLKVIQASMTSAQGSTIQMVPVDEVLYFEAADKYVRVVTADREHLIRLSLRELLPQLDPQAFWQVHRSTVVQARLVASAHREESGKVTLTLKGRGDKLVASRLYAHLFKGM